MATDPQRALIPSDGPKRYSHTHFWREDAPRCGLMCMRGTQAIGECLWPREPGLPWCNPHIEGFLSKMRAQGYQSENVRAYFASLAWDAVAIETAVARFEVPRG